MKTAKSENSGRIIRALTKIGEAITSDLYLEDILKLIVAVTAEAMGSNICSILLLDKSGKELIVKAAQSVSEEYNKKENIKLGEGIAGKAAKDGQPITVLDVRKDKRYRNRDIAVRENLCSLLSMPLISKNKVIGVLNCYTPKIHRFSRSEINVLKSVANQAAIVIENFRLIVESNVIKEELESRKVVERAKGILMKKDALGEEEAYARIRKYSMDKRRSMREIAEAIILNEEIGRTE